MICLTCGREITGKDGICRGCGTKVEKDRLELDFKAAHPKKVLKLETKFFGLKIWQLLSVLMASIVVLFAAALIIPNLSFSLPKLPKPSISKPTTTTTAALDVVPNTSDMLTIPNSRMLDYVLNYQEAYIDGSMFEERVVDNCVTVRLYRKNHIESGIGGHINVLFPGLAEAPNYEEPDTVTCNGAAYNRSRALIPAESMADNCVKEIVMLSSTEQNAQYDFIMVISTPAGVYNDYRDDIVLWTMYLDIVPPEQGNMVFEDPAAVQQADPAVQI